MQLERIPIKVGHLGVVREAAVDESISSPESMELAVNVNFDRIGASQTRKGLTVLGDQIAPGNILGMTSYRNNAGDTYRLLAKVSNAIYAYDGSWSSVLTGLSTTSKARFTNFLDLTYMVEGNENGAPQTYNGSSFGSTNVASLPAGDFIENYRSRIWVADSSTDKVYYSDVVSTSQTITGGTDFIQISPQDGEKITALKRHPRALLVFKNNHIYKIFSTDSADPDPSIFRGTYSHESVVETKDGLYYHHPTGFYRFSFDDKQQEISRPIIDIVEAIDRSNYENITGWTDNDHICWSVGDVILKDVTYQNVVVRYTISTEVWTIYSYPSELTSSALYDDGTSLTLIVGDENGYPYIFDNGNTDNGTAIFYDIQTHPLYLTNIRNEEKRVSEIGVVHENAQGATVSYQEDNGDWSKSYTISKGSAQSFTTDAKFKRIRLRFQGTTIGSQIIFRGWELLKLISEGIKKRG